MSWGLVESLGASSPLWYPLDQWLVAERLDGEVLTALARTTSAENLDTLWRCHWVHQLTRWSYAAALDAISDSISLRCFTRIGWQKPPEPRWFRQFAQINRLALQQVWLYMAEVRMRNVREARRPREHERLLNQWAEQVMRGRV